MTGQGKHLNLNRRLIEEREAGKAGRAVPPNFTVSIDDIALIETNDPGPSFAGGLAVVTGVTAGFAVYCLIYPKACMQVSNSHLEQIAGSFGCGFMDTPCNHTVRPVLMSDVNLFDEDFSRFP